jgi:DNA mismatch repair protein MutS
LLQCKCYIADKYNYCKPKIVDNKEQKSFVNFTGIRHPLIEHLQLNEIYVTNDLNIGSENNEMNGLLLYGTNAVGKTSFIKSVGIAIIMAQSGLYVSCSNFEYKPYSYIFTRILGNDNLFKGLSTFAVEMSELRTIITQANQNSLVLGDELCSGTESDSALSIFTAGLEHLHKKKCTFLFATHFHEIVKYDEIKALTKLKMKHMAVRYDKEYGVLIYDRKLQDGPGDSMYGLEVCKSLNLPDDFLHRAHDIRMKYNKGVQNMLSLDNSHFNTQKIVSNCQLCNNEKATEVHHLQHQKNANKSNNYINTFHKNHPANLLNICESCHQKIHSSTTQHKVCKTTKGTYILKAII